MNFERFCDRVIEYSFYALFFLVPLIFTPWNFELFEYNKMMLTYALTVVIVGAWLAKMVLEKKILFKRSLLDIPLLIFFVSQFLSFLVSIDRHTSLFGYYSRFHGGLLSTFSYLLLYWAFVSNMDCHKTIRTLLWTLSAGVIVSLYGILEHFGHSLSCLLITGEFNVVCWIQDVQNRVFATLGQPNWLAAWLAVLGPLAWALTLKNRKTEKQKNILGFSVSRSLSFLVAALFYLTLLYTKSRSGIPAAFLSLVLFFFLMALPKITSFKKQLLYPLLLLFAIILAGSGFWGIKTLFKNTSQDIAYILDLTDKVQIPIHQVYDPGSESGDIRKVVWRGAIKIFKNYPIFGSGVETFAYSYYQFRPIEHNLLSEWDFLYNKAHNEYLNFLATTGAVGLGSYLLLIGWFLVWSVRQIKNQISKIKITEKNSKFCILDCHFDIYILHFALLAGYASILITNFFGFSVVPVALLFFLYPAMAIVLTTEKQKNQQTEKQKNSFSVSPFLSFSVLLILLSIFYLLFTISKFWYADTLFAKGQSLEKQGYYNEAFTTLQKTIKLNSQEPVYHDEFAYTTSILAVRAASENQTDLTNQLISLSLSHSNQALKVSPRHLNFWRTRTKIFYNLAKIDPSYLLQAQKTLEEASTLAPTDAKILYNLGLIYYQLKQKEKAIETFRKTIELKPNYNEAQNALELILKEKG